MTTIVEGEQLLGQYEMSLYSVHETIRGGDVGNPHPGMPEHFDTSRHVSLYHSEQSMPPKGVIYLQAMNTKDHAVCVLDQRKKPADLSGLHVTVDGELMEDLANWSTNEGLWRIQEGQKFQVWIGGDTFDDRDPNYGYATVTWKSPALA